jgi:hypothetical protein
MTDPFVLSVQFEHRFAPKERARLGVYYTPREDILLLVEPVLMRPLRREWEQIQNAVGETPLSYTGMIHHAPTDTFFSPSLCMERGSGGEVSKPTHATPRHVQRDQILTRLRTITVLDPACGSGNFLVVALECLLDLEREVIQSPLWRDLPPETTQVSPRQMFGIEKDPEACALAREILALEGTDNIQCGDALFSPSPCTGRGLGGGVLWPAVEVILSNPPFLGSRKLRPKLGDAYVDGLVAAYGDAFGKRTPDLVCYWFERARCELEQGRVRRVGFIATNSIRGGTNRRVLERIAQTGQLFLAWSDRDWTQNGATVNVSIVAFDNTNESEITLDGQPVAHINPDLTGGVDLTAARRLGENRLLAFQGIIRRGAFDLPEAQALAMIQADPTNADVLKPIYNGDDLAHRPRHRWVIDFGHTATLKEAQRYGEPFAYVEHHVKPFRETTNQPRARERWWLHWNPRPEMRRALAPLSRYLATPAISKHRVFVWIDRGVHPDHALIVFAREDDYFFGVLHSHIHQLWALRLGTSLENRPRYTPTTVFETFPFPFRPGEEDPTQPAYQAISEAARNLHEQRCAWLQEWRDVHTLTHLYNALHCYRNPTSPTGRRRKFPPAALEFAPQLDHLHRILDAAVCAAYGWPESILDDEQTVLKALLARNRQVDSS